MFEWVAGFFRSVGGFIYKHAWFSSDERYLLDINSSLDELGLIQTDSDELIASLQSFLSSVSDVGSAKNVLVVFNDWRSFFDRVHHWYSNHMALLDPAFKSKSAAVFRLELYNLGRKKRLGNLLGAARSSTDSAERYLIKFSSGKGGSVKDLKDYLKKVISDYERFQSIVPDFIAEARALVSKAKKEFGVVE